VGDETGVELAWDATELEIIGMIMAGIDRKVALNNDYDAAADDPKLRLKLSSGLKPALHHLDTGVCHRVPDIPLLHVLDFGQVGEEVNEKRHPRQSGREFFGPNSAGEYLRSRHAVHRMLGAPTEAPRRPGERLRPVALSLLKVPCGACR
jgi:hypothetical protein